MLTNHFASDSECRLGKVIAEGVETKEQRDFIVENGYESIQGYFYSKPMDSGEFEELLRKGF